MRRPESENTQTNGTNIGLMTICIRRLGKDYVETQIKGLAKKNSGKLADIPRRICKFSCCPVAGVDLPAYLWLCGFRTSVDF
jgi:predicted ATP-grasp superfamily ATP-dependent carboligase